MNVITQATLAMKRQYALTVMVVSAVSVEQGTEEMATVPALVSFVICD